GRSLDDKRALLDDHDGDLQDVREKWAEREKHKPTDREANCFMVPAQEIREGAYDLTVGRYRQAMHKELTYETPEILLNRLRQIEHDIAKSLNGLTTKLRSTEVS